MPFTVLMVCTGNICRSPMAEGLLAKRLPESLNSLVTVRSAGTHSLHGNRAEPFAIKAAAAHGVDIGNHRASILDAKMIRRADLVLAMERKHIRDINGQLLFGCKYAKLLGAFAGQEEPLEIDDPYGDDYEVYEATADTILMCIPGLIAYIQHKLNRKRF